jgi:hypothetical protein
MPSSHCASHACDIWLDSRWTYHRVAADFSSTHATVIVILRCAVLRCAAPYYAVLCCTCTSTCRAVCVPWARPQMATTACCQASPWEATAAWHVTGPWPHLTHGLDLTCLLDSYLSAWLLVLRWLRQLVKHLARWVRLHTALCSTDHSPAGGPVTSEKVGWGRWQLCRSTCQASGAEASGAEVSAGQALGKVGAAAHCTQ